jgi:hypothetical protein
MNAEKALPEKQIEIAGKSYTVCFDLRALIALEKATGGNPFSMRFWAEPTPSLVAQMLHAALSRHHKMKLDDAIDLVGSMGELQTVFEQLQKAFSDAQPAPKDDEQQTNATEGAAEEKNA